jgi:hypothetical protein
MVQAAHAVERGLWVPEHMPFGQMPARFGYLISPSRAHAASAQQKAG